MLNAGLRIGRLGNCNVRWRSHLTPSNAIALKLNRTSPHQMRSP
ncbi:hypothetical protein [Tolypothrix sp. VBCCA 56010]